MLNKVKHLYRFTLFNMTFFLLCYVTDWFQFAYKAGFTSRVKLVLPSWPSLVRPCATTK